jgi:hypothetical protein
MSQQNNPSSLRWEFLADDQGPAGGVKFVTTAEMTGGSPYDIPADALLRLMCFYFISRFSTDALHDATRSLGETYAWQIERAKFLEQPTPTPVVQRQKSKRVRYEKPAPFSYSED